jgi:hypothetical protein
MNKQKQELIDKLARYQGALDQTTDKEEREIMQGVIDKLKNQIKEIPAEETEPAPEPKPAKKAVPKKKKEPAKEKPQKKVVVVPKKKKAEKPAEEKKKPGKKFKVTPKSKKEPAEKKVEKTVKVSKVIPEDEKTTVKNVLEKEHFKVVFKVVGGKKVKVTIRHSDKTVAKNKVESAFNTISKKVNSEEEKKKYAKDVQLLESMQKAFTDFIERIYKAFNSHDAKELSALARKLKSL